MAAVVADYMALGMNHVQADALATQINGTSTGLTQNMIGLGFSVPLAVELTRQMVAGVGTASNLMALGIPPSLATLIAADIEATASE